MEIEHIVLGLLLVVLTAWLIVGVLHWADRHENGSVPARGIDRKRDRALSAR